MKRYSAKLLFQYRADLGNGKSDIMRRCEERLIVLSARNAQSALRKAKAHGKSSEFDAEAEAGNPLLFEFIGVMDLLEIGAECDTDEVWYDIITRKLPMERKDKLIPPEEKLNAIFWERESKKQGNPIGIGPLPIEGPSHPTVSRHPARSGDRVQGESAVRGRNLSEEN